MECRRGLAMRIPSVRLSNACIVTKRKKKSVHIFIPCERSFSLVFREEEWLMGAIPSTVLPEILGQPAPVGAKWPILNRQSLVAPRAFQWAYKMIIVRCLWARKRGSKPQNCRFPSKIALRLKKVCYKLSLCKNCQRQSCNAFIGLTRPNGAKMIGRDVSFYLKF